MNRFLSFLRSSTFLQSAALATVLCLLLAPLGCSSAGTASTTTTTPPASTGVVPQFGHVVLVVEENSSYSQVIGSSDMPYLNSLASQYGLATQYYANTHPSTGNYFMLTAGQLVTTNDSYAGTVDVDNIVRELIASGKTWKSYAENRDDPTLYVQRHDPLSYFTDVVNSSAQMQNLVPFSQFSADLSGDNLPNFSFIVPNLLDDAHSAPLQVADAWLQQNIAPLLTNATFQNDGLLIITFDESVGTDAANGGGHLATLVLRPQAKQGYESTT